MLGSGAASLVSVTFSPAGGWSAAHRPVCMLGVLHPLAVSVRWGEQGRLRAVADFCGILSIHFPLQGLLYGGIELGGCPQRWRM